MAPYPTSRASPSRVSIFGRRPRGHQRVKAADRPARHGDEGEGKELAAEDGAGAVHELRHRRHLDRRQREQDTGGQGQDRPDLQKGRQVVARAEQHPDGKDAGDEAVPRHQPHQRRLLHREDRRQRRIVRHPSARDDGEQRQHHADQRRLQHLAGTEAVQPPPHQQRDGDGAGDGEQPPRRVRQRVYHDQRQHGEQDGT